MILGITITDVKLFLAGGIIALVVFLIMTWLRMDK